MNKKIFIIISIVIIILLIIITIFICTNYNNHLYKTIEESFDKMRYRNKTLNHQEQLPIRPIINQYNQLPIRPIINQTSLLEQNSLERISNPLKFPYKSEYYYNQPWYPNLQLPAQVIGCGGRNTPCIGGTQIPIENPLPPINISDDNIAPINISTRGPIGVPQQIGAIYKIYGNDNSVLPLFGRRKYRNDNKWEYYTMIGRFGVKMPIIVPNKNIELGTNDNVFIKGIRKNMYRVTIYESDEPQYIPYF